eukprot:TRINITY_DN38452_c0_g1_i1.p1 TRINITY_DN38452_c0_g1~~TRINITY_DN38452_c0_g1_i1.p1  ORF type:complete len:721 (+),score=77.39 TRINITY_DN38452_c0_g1_i1:169-2331(+)
MAGLPADLLPVASSRLSSRRTSTALRAAIERSPVIRVRNSSWEQCAARVAIDLLHVARRSSKACFEHASAAYCDRVVAAEEFAHRPRSASRLSEQCSRRSKGPPRRVDVRMHLAKPARATIAFLILAFDRLGQVRRLIHRIYDPDHTVFLVHIDRKLPSVQDRVVEFSRWAKTNFHEGENRVRIFSELKVHRGGRSMLDVQLRALELLLSYSVQWDYFINLSDTHYPAETVIWMSQYLWLHRGANYARITSTKYYDPTLQGGKDATYSGPRSDDLYIACDRSLAFECDGKLFSLSPGVKYPPLLSDVTAASGPEWVIFSRGFAKYIVDGILAGTSTGSLVAYIYNDLVALSIPEETFFQTVLMSSTFCETHVRHDFLYLDLNDAPWRTSPHSDFPFQSPRSLNMTHAFEVGRDEPWFVRKIDTSIQSSQSFVQALDSVVERRARWTWDQTARSSSWIAMPPAQSLRRAVASMLGESGRGEVTAVRRWRRPHRLQAMYLTPTVLELDLRVPCSVSSTTRSRSCNVSGKIRLVERVAVPEKNSDDIATIAPVAAMRVGCQWEEEKLEFRGDVSIISSTACGALSLVSYVTNVGFEGDITIEWLHEGRLVRKSGGEIPKGYTMFVDRLEPPRGKFAPGRWTIHVSSRDGTYQFGNRDFLIYDIDSISAHEQLEALSSEELAPSFASVSGIVDQQLGLRKYAACPSIEDYLTFFELEDIRDDRM